MRLKSATFKLLMLLFCFLFVAPCLGNNISPKRIRGIVVAYQRNSLIIVRTIEKKCIILNHSQFSTNPISEADLQKEQIRDFAVEPIADCKIPFSFFRRNYRSPQYGNEDQPKNVQLEAPQLEQVLNSYPQLDFINQKYKEELDVITDKTVLPCFDINLTLSNPSYKERLVTGIVLGDNNVPLSSYSVSIGFSGVENSYLYVQTNDRGEFSIPIYENFSYWIRANRAGFAGQKEYKAVLIPKKIAVKPIRLRLEFE